MPWCDAREVVSIIGTQQNAWAVAIAVLLVATAAPTRASEGSIAFTSPADGSTVSGVVIATGTATDENGITGVRVRIDEGEWLFADVTGETSATWSRELDFTFVTDGAHTVTAQARTAGGSFLETSIAVVVEGGLDTDLVAESVEGRGGLSPTMTFAARVTQAGTMEDLSGVEARFDLRYKDEWHTAGATTFDVAAGETVEVTHDWTVVGVVGEFAVRVVLDPAGAVAEVSADNNEAIGTGFFWTNAVPGQDVTDPNFDDPTPTSTHTVRLLSADPLGGSDLAAPHVAVVRVGDAVVFENADPTGTPHVATRARWDAEGFDSGVLAAGQSSEPHVFSSPGEYVYYCSLHTRINPGPTAYVVVLQRTDA